MGPCMELTCGACLVLLDVRGFRLWAWVLIPSRVVMRWVGFDRRFMEGGV